MSVNIYHTIGVNIRAARRAANMTLEQLAEKAGISAGFLSYIEKGKRKCSVDTVYRIAGALDLNICALFGAANAESLVLENIIKKVIRELVLNKAFLIDIGRLGPKSGNDG
ncbi:MAG: helix-turn-helix transcriptional regulator [Elusimicrobiaceae bacterium]|nr:helix-turn-helix transcriptional regulator [Elusimicrobiaceae bacterium]